MHCCQSVVSVVVDGGNIQEMHITFCFRDPCNLNVRNAHYIRYTMQGCHSVSRLISWSVFVSIIYTFHFISLAPLLYLMCCSHQCDILIWKLQGDKSHGRPSLDGNRVFIFIVTEYGVRMWTGLTGIWFCQVEDICEYCNELYLVHVHALYQISTNKCTHILLNHHFINTIHNSNMLQPLKGHLQGV